MYEIPLLAFAAILAGLFLMPSHPAFFILIILGLLVFLWPTLAPAIYNVYLAWRVNRAANSLRTTGFATDIILRGNRSEGAVALDAKAGVVAFIDPAGKTEVVALADIKGIELTTATHTKLGGSPSWTWHYMKFERPEGENILVYSSRFRARRLLKKLGRLIGHAVPVHDGTGKRTERP